MQSQELLNTEVEIDTMNRHLYSMRYQQYQSIKDLSEEELIESEAYLKYLECIGLTKSKLAKELNLSLSTISRWEKTLYIRSIKHVVLLASLTQNKIFKGK